MTTPGHVIHRLWVIELAAIIIARMGTQAGDDKSVCFRKLDEMLSREWLGTIPCTERLPLEKEGPSLLLAA